MFNIQTQLFEGLDVRFGPIDYEKDPGIESKWTHDSEFMRMYEINPARPLSAAFVKKQYEKLEKQVEEDKNLYHFMIRAKEDDRLIGKAAIQWIEWTNGNAWVHLRQFLNREGLRWNELYMGILREEWMEQNEQ